MVDNQSASLLAEALQKLNDALEEASANDVPEPYIMALATADAQGKPSVRSILLANINDVGLLFFANKKSGKGKQLADNPHVAICFFWPTLHLQVVIDGVVKVETEAEANRIWSKRARANQLAAWASRQSEESAGKQALASRVAEVKHAFSDERVPMPVNWAGYRVHPTRIEFWRTGWSRMKDRTCYRLEDEQWVKLLLDP